MSTHIEPSRDPERRACAWIVLPGMAQREAREFFDSRVKPQSYQYERFYYDPKTGQVHTA